MLSVVKTGTLWGIEGEIVYVEVDINSGLPNIIVVGLPNIMVKEAKDRVRSAIVNSGLKFPMNRITINLSPANLKKDGSHFDLPIAIGILISSGEIKPFKDMNETAFVGELSLNGNVGAVDGVLPIVASLKEKGIKKFFVPKENLEEALLVKDLEIYPVESLLQLINHLKGKEFIEAGCRNYNEEKELKFYEGIDFNQVKGQDSVKRAVIISCSGGHGMFMVGTPGAGKTMIAKRIPTVLPPLDYNECMEITKIYSVCGEFTSKSGLVKERPFRIPHHTISATALVGGGTKPKPGELSKAHRGILFLDEFPEFSKSALETLRQPLEDKKINVSRAAGTAEFPCNTTLVVAANPCPCGYLGSNKHICTCSEKQISSYKAKMSGPILDRIDIHINVLQPEFAEVENNTETLGSNEMLEIIMKARNKQKTRYENENIKLNSELSSSLIKKYCKIDSESKLLLKSAFENLGMSMRAYDKILKIARTIADIDGSEDIGKNHIAEAIGYRFMDRKRI